jgi:hypothetical protein
MLLALLWWPGDASAQQGPRPPCGVDPIPAYAPPSAPPNVQIWRPDGVWTAPVCGGWRPGAFKVVVALAGSFRHGGGAEELLERFGRVSGLRGVRYWSVTDKKWRLLIEDAAALDGPEGGDRRTDFRSEEMKGGGALYFSQTETRLPVAVVYRMRVREFAPDRVVVETENVTAVRFALIPIIKAGDMRAVHYLERRAPGLWGYYALAFSGPYESLFLRIRDASLVNRAAALYRHFVGVPTDRDPPLAP